MNFGD